MAPRFHVVHLGEAGGWLVAADDDDAAFRYALERPPVRRAMGAGVWHVPPSGEAVLLRALGFAVRPDEVCPTCLREDAPCAAWEALLDGWFAALEESARQATRAAAAYREAVETARRISAEERAQRGPWRSVPRSGYDDVEDIPPPRRSDTDLRDAARLLGISWPATRDEIIKAFRRAALRHHPDVGGSDAAMVAVVEARRVLLEG